MLLSGTLTSLNLLLLFLSFPLSFYSFSSLNQCPRRFIQCSLRPPCTPHSPFTFFSIPLPFPKCPITFFPHATPFSTPLLFPPNLYPSVPFVHRPLHPSFHSSFQTQLPPNSLATSSVSLLTPVSLTLHFLPPFLVVLNFSFFL